MPHPEHAVDTITGPGADGLGFFAPVRTGAPVGA
jgi:phosphoribosylformylglycinamidine (FGAM) synthase-like amidotransferase family enzyme